MDSPGNIKMIEMDEIELYDVTSDISEPNNVTENYPKK